VTLDGRGRPVFGVDRDVTQVVETPQVVLEQTLGRMRTVREEIALAMTSAVFDEVPEFRAIRAAEFRDEVYLHSLDHVDAFIETAEAGLQPQAVSFGFVHSRGAQRARELLPLDALLHAYRLGQREVWRAVVAAAGRDRDAALALSEFTIAYLNAISTAVAGAYGQSERHAVAEIGRRRRELLEDIVDSPEGLGVPGERRCAALGLNLAQPHAVVIASTTASVSDPLVLLEHALRATLQQRPAFTVSLHDDGVVLLARPVEDTTELASALAAGIPRDLRLGVGGAGVGIPAIAQSYAEARRALLATTAERRIVAFAALPLEDHVAAIADPLLRTAAARVAGALLEQDDAKQLELVRSLRAYVDADLNIRVAAGRLFVHPNTLYYRLARLRELTGRDPRRMSQARELVLALAVLARTGE
jgi:DNA-binding PucR family transcriptional regulator